ncbi:MAG TPA: helix-turn-helix domain-containing protein [Longimicrobiales bacterium]
MDARSTASPLARRQAHTAPLPRILEELCERFGQEAAHRVAAELGGQTVNLPRRVGPSNPLGKRVGFEVLSWLVSRYGGGARISVPLGPVSQRATRARLIADLLAEGHPANVVAKRVGCSVRTVHRHRRSATMAAGGIR